MTTRGLSESAIQGIIRRKIAEWLASIDDEELRNFLKDKIIVTGGCIASMILGTRVNDYDVYFTTREAVIRVAKYYLKKFAANPPKHKAWQQPVRIYVDDQTSTDRVKIVIKSVGVASIDGDKGEYEFFETTPEAATAESYVDMVTSGIAQDDSESKLRSEINDAEEAGFLEPDIANAEFMRLAQEQLDQGMPPKEVGRGAKEKNMFRPLFVTANAITLSDKIQLCIRFYGTPAEVHANFDFVHCTNYWQSEAGINNALSGTLVTNKEAYGSLTSRKLKYIGSRYPLCSLIRTRKFIARGWSAPASVFIKPMFQATQLNWNNLATWEEQLTGVDYAYFHEILEILRREQAEGKQLDGAYVIALIDRLV